MKKEEIQNWDWARIMIGNAPAEFMLEVFLRTVVIYVLLLVAMRLFGKRLNTHVSILDMAITVTLGAIISPGMQLPDRGIVPTIIVLVSVVVFQRLISMAAFASRKVEVLTQGDVTLLVKNGIIDVGQLKNTVISHEQLFEQLRGNKIRHLGQVKRVYLEASGQFSIFRNAKEKPGLCILPTEDEKVYRSERRTDHFLACKNCGNVKEKHANAAHPCSLCGANDWDLAVAREKPAEKPGATRPHHKPEETPVPAPSGA